MKLLDHVAYFTPPSNELNGEHFFWKISIKRIEKFNDSIREASFLLIGTYLKHLLVDTASRANPSIVTNKWSNLSRFAPLSPKWFRDYYKRSIIVCKHDCNFPRSLFVFPPQKASFHFPFISWNVTVYIFCKKGNVWDANAGTSIAFHVPAGVRAIPGLRKL